MSDLRKTNKLTNYIENEPKTRKYSKISLDLRTELIRLVIQQQFSVYEAARQLLIKYATAKVIVRQYRGNKRIFVKKSECFVDKIQARDEDRIQMSVQNNQSQIMINAQQSGQAKFQPQEQCYQYPFLLVFTSIFPPMMQ